MSEQPTTSDLVPPVSARDHARGPAAAPLTLVEYGDFECPFCGDAFGVVEAVRRQLGARLRFVFRHFPVPAVHPYALRAAEAAEAAAAQGRFWEWHDFLYARQPALAERDLLRYAGELDLDVERFQRELRERVHAERVREDVLSGELSGVAYTPTFFVNGRRHAGAWDRRALLAALEGAGPPPA